MLISASIQRRITVLVLERGDTSGKLCALASHLTSVFDGLLPLSPGPRSRTVNAIPWLAISSPTYASLP